jgi:2-dehydrotetronate isomerase
LKGYAANLGFLWPDLPLDRRIDAAAAAGFRAIEFHWPFDLLPEAVAARCAALGIAILGVNTPVGDAESGEFGFGAVPDREGDFRAAFDKALDWARRAGGTAVHAMAGIVAPEDEQRALSIFAANLAWACDRAAGLDVLIEPINRRDKPGYFLSTTDLAAELIAGVARPNLRIMFDIYHVAIAEGDVTRRLERMKDLIGHVQIAAVPSRAEPDEGEIDYRAILATLDRIGYRGWVGAEYRPRGDTDVGLVWRKQLAARR